MAKFHINPTTGVTGECKSTEGKCPFGGETSHYPSRENAQKAFELSNAGQTLPASVSKGDPGMEGMPMRATTQATGIEAMPKYPAHTVSSMVRIVDGELTMERNAEATINRWPSTYSDRADEALRHATATMYEYAETNRLTRDEFRAEAEKAFGKLEKEHLEDGISDTEPRVYWREHMDEIHRLNGWVSEDY